MNGARVRILLEVLAPVDPPEESDGQADTPWTVAGRPPRLRVRLELAGRVSTTRTVGAGRRALLRHRARSRGRFAVVLEAFRVGAGRRGEVVTVHVATQAGPGNISNTIAVCDECEWRQVFLHRTEAITAAYEHNAQVHNRVGVRPAQSGS